MKSRVFSLGKNPSTVVAESIIICIREGFYVEYQEKYGKEPIAVHSHIFEDRKGEFYVAVYCNEDVKPYNIMRLFPDQEYILKFFKAEAIETEIKEYDLDPGVEQNYIVNVAESILEQIGEETLNKMPLKPTPNMDLDGANTGRGGLTMYMKDGTRVRIVLNHMDLYDITFYNKDGDITETFKELYHNALPKLYRMYNEAFRMKIGG